MRDLVLHIGRHKTGTTAIQHFLNDNRKALESQGYFVPETGKVNAGHHGFSRPLQAGNVKEKPITDPARLPPFLRLQEEIATVDPALCLVVSSEAFQNCEPALVHQAFEGFNIRIVVYLRNQLEYLASAYAQRVHATSYGATLTDFYRDVFLSGVNYLKFLEPWVTEFPVDFVVRRYQHSNVVGDFAAHALGIENQNWVPGPPLSKLQRLTRRLYRLGGFRRGQNSVQEDFKEPSNPSLNAKITEFKRQLNRRNLDDQPSLETMYFLLPRLNAAFPAPKMALTPATAQALIAQCLPSDTAVARQYFDETQLFDYQRFATAPQPELSDAEFHEIYAALKALIADIPGKRAP